MSRRERREAEQAGRIAAPHQPDPDLARVALVQSESSQPTPQAQVESGQLSDAPALLSRRDLRDRERTGLVSRMRTAVTPTETDASRQEVLPEISLSSQVSVVEKPAFADPIYSAEPSTNSIVLDRIPDAVGVPIEVTGEIITTGSIAILTEPVNTVLTGPLDDRALDSISANDAVTGAITVVEPVSALQVIKNRPIQSVLPVRSLRSGWWKPLLLAAATLAMVAAAVAAALVIISTLGL
jgi:hypothetical protein